MLILHLYMKKMLSSQDKVDVEIVDEFDIFILKFMLYKNLGIVFYVHFFRMFFYKKSSLKL